MSDAKKPVNSPIEERFRRLFDAQPDASFHISGDGVLLDMNQRAAEILGYTREEMIGQPLALVVPAESLNDSHQKIAGLKAGRAYPSYRKSFRAKNGRLIPFEITLVSTVAANGEIIIQSICRDLRMQLETERQLQSSEDRFRALVESAVDAIWTKDIDGRFTLVNEAMLHKLSLRREQVIGLTAAEVFAPETALEIMRTDRQSIDEGKTIRVEHHMIFNNRTYIIQVVKAPLRDAEGHIVGLVGIDRDVTDERNLGDQLLQAQKMEVVSAMAGGIAHDFNNLLTSIIGNLSLSQLKLEQGEDAASLVQLALDAADQAAKLTRQLLQISRRQPTKVSAANLREVIGEVLALLRSTFDRRIQLMDNLSDDLWPVRADANQIHQIIMNLCLNSRDALQERHGADYRSSKGHPWLQITAENVVVLEAETTGAGPARPGSYVRLTISDNGIGMDRATMARIFEPFFTTKPKDKGTGLGLAMVYTIVTSHGGWINVESEPGIGADMVIHLPKADEAPAEHEVRPPAPAVQAISGRILVVEDDSPIRQLIHEVLAQRGFAVQEAKDGLEAWALLKRDDPPFDLVILDLIMPELSGYEVLQRMHRKGLQLPVIVCSGFPGDISESELHELGVRLFLAKPFDLNVFIQSVYDVLGSAETK